MGEYGMKNAGRALRVYYIRASYTAAHVTSSSIPVHDGEVARMRGITCRVNY